MNNNRECLELLDTTLPDGLSKIYYLTLINSLGGVSVHSHERQDPYLIYRP